MRIPCGCALLLVAAALGGFWFVAMSWSHSFGSKSAQLQEALVIGGAIACALVGFVLIALGLAEGNGESERPPP